MKYIRLWDGAEIHAALSKLAGAEAPAWVKSQWQVCCTLVRMKDKRGTFLALRFHTGERLRIRTHSFTPALVGLELQIDANMGGWRDCSLADMYDCMAACDAHAKQPVPDLWESIN